MAEARDPSASLIELEGTLEQPKIRVQLVYVVAPVQNELQALLDKTRLASEWVGRADSFSGRFADAHFHIEPADNNRMSLRELKQETSEWILSSAFQAAIEIANYPLEQARRVLALWDMIRRNRAGQEVRLDYEDDAEWFHGQSFVRKLEFLESEHGFSIDPQATDILKRLHRARNVIIHRFGRVLPKDCDEDGIMRAPWEEYVPFAIQNDGTPRRVNFPGTIFAGEEAQVRRLTKVREFKAGDVIRLSGQDINEVCHTIHLFASQVRDDLRKKSIALDLPIEGKCVDARLAKPRAAGG